MTEVEIGQLAELFAVYTAWCKANGLLAEFDEKFFDWMNDV